MGVRATFVIVGLTALASACTDSPETDAGSGDALVLPDVLPPHDAYLAPDAGPPRCEALTPAPLDLSAGTWSHDYGPRGVTFEGDGDGVIFDVATAGTTLYATGHFTFAGPIAAQNVASWNEASGWAALGDGVPGYGQRIAARPDGTVYVSSTTDASASTLASEIFAFDPTSGTWTSIGSADGQIEALAIDADGSLLVGGFYFATIGGTAISSHLGRWTGSAWADVPTSPGYGTDVAAIVVDAYGVCIGGREGGSGGYVACRAPSATTWTWMSLPTAPGPWYPNPVDAILHDSMGRVVVSGALYYAGGAMQQGGTLRWNGTDWEPLATGLGDNNSGMEVKDLAQVTGGDIFAIGSFSTIGPYTDWVFALHVAVWSREHWLPVGGVQGSGYYGPFASASDGTRVFVAGGIDDAFLFSPSTWHRVRDVAYLDHTDWHALPHPGAHEHGPASVAAVAATGTCDPIIAGGFGAIEDTQIGSVARMQADGAWAGVATITGFDTYYGSYPDAVADGPDGTLYAAGNLVLAAPAGTGEHAPIVRNVGGEWETFGTFPDGARGEAIAFAPDGSLYLGGSWSDPDDPDRSDLLRWDGTTWSAVGHRETPQPIVAMTFDGDALIVAESWAAGGVGIARWDGATWSPVGADFPTGRVDALGIWRGQLVAAGQGLVDGEPVALFDGTAWTALGALGGDTVEALALAVQGDTLVAGGLDRSLATGAVVPFLVRRTDATWTTLASVDGPVTSLVFTGRGLAVGGDFEVVGGVPSWGFALLTP